MKILIAVGIDTYEDRSITPLTGAANDVREFGAFCQYKLNFDRVHRLTDGNGNGVLNLLSEAMKPLGENDLLVFFFAGHGKSVNGANGKPDQIFLLQNANRASMEQGFYNTGTMSLAQITAITQKQGLRRVFIFDACRLPIEVEANDGRDDAAALRFEGEAIYRDFALRANEASKIDSPLAILNGCADKQRAREIPAERRGLFAISLQETITHELERGMPVLFNTAFDNLLNQTMDKVAVRHNIVRGEQHPSRQGAEVCLIGNESETGAETKRLLAAFRAQFAAKKFDSPAADNCSATLTALRGKGFDPAMLAKLSTHLQEAQAQQRLASDREHDERLFKLVQQQRTEVTCNNYLAQCKLHEHDETVQGYLDQNAWEETIERNTSGAYMAYLRRFPTGKYAVQAQQWLTDYEARKDSNRQQEADQAAWRIAIEDNTEDAFTLYLAEQREGSFRTKAEHLRQERKQARLQEEGEKLALKIQEQDEIAWHKAHAADSVLAYEEYLVQQQNGKYRDAATFHINRKSKNNISTLKADSTPIRTKILSEPTGGDDAEEWKSASAQHSAESYTAYLAKHPGGKYRTEAIARLRRRNKTLDKQTWDLACKANTEEAYTKYLTTHIYGIYTEEAKEQFTLITGRDFNQDDIIIMQKKIKDQGKHINIFDSWNKIVIIALIFLVIYIALGLFTK